MNQGAEQRDSSKENHENDGKVEKQTLYTSACLKHRTCAAAAEDAAQACATDLEQD